MLESIRGRAVSLQVSVTQSYVSVTVSHLSVFGEFGVASALFDFDGSQSDISSFLFIELIQYFFTPAL